MNLPGEGCLACRVGAHIDCYDPNGCRCGHLTQSLQKKPQWPATRTPIPRFNDPVFASNSDYKD